MISKTSANSNTTLAHRLWSWWVLRFKLAEVGPQWITIFSPLCPYAKYPKSPCPARPWSSFILDGLSPFLLKMWPWKIHLIHFPALTPPITGFLSHLWLAAVRIRWCPSWPQWLTQMCRACLKMWEIPVGYLWMCNFFHEDTYECAILHFFSWPWNFGDPIFERNPSVRKYLKRFEASSRNCQLGGIPCLCLGSSDKLTFASYPLVI